MTRNVWSGFVVCGLFIRCSSSAVSHWRARLHTFLHQLLGPDLLVPHVGVATIELEQLMMGAGFGDAAFMQT